MKIRDVVEKTGATVLVPGDMERDLTGAISGDLLSFIMAEAREGWLWITIQGHLNVAAVAVLQDVPWILVASGRAPEQALSERCAVEGITLAVTPLSAFDAAGLLRELAR